MYRTYELTDKEIGKITRLRWDGDTYYYDVFESQEECDKEQERLVSRFAQNVTELRAKRN